MHRKLTENSLLFLKNGALTPPADILFVKVVPFHVPNNFFVNYIDMHRKLTENSLLFLKNGALTPPVKVKQQENKKLLFLVKAAWQYDICPLHNAGGGCAYYKPHNGRKIAYTAELDIIKEKHLNYDLYINESEINKVEDIVSKLVVKSSLF